MLQEASQRLLFLLYKGLNGTMSKGEVANEIKTLLGENSEEKTEEGSAATI